MQATKPVIGDVLGSGSRSIEDAYFGRVVAVPEINGRYLVVIREPSGTYVLLSDTGEIIDTCKTLDQAEDLAFCDLVYAAIVGP